MNDKKSTNKQEPIIFRNYNEAMETLFPNVLEKEQEEDCKRVKKEEEAMEELAGSVLSRF